MATESLQITDVAGGNVYFSIWKSAAAEVFDFDDNTFKALGSAVEPFVAATEVSGRGGVGDSGYHAGVDLADINNTPAIAVYVVEAYRRLGGSPALTTDLLLSTGELRIAAGSLVASGSPGDVVSGYVVKCCMALTSTEGDEVQLWAWVEKNGVPITLDAGDECSFDCFEHTSGLSQFSGPTTAVNPSAVNLFEDVFTPTEFADNTGYTLQATAVIGGVTIVGQESFPCVGSS